MNLQTIKTLTPKAEKLLSLIVKDATVPNKTKTKAELMREAGYSEKSLHNPQLIMNTPKFLANLAKALEGMQEIRNLALVSAKRKIAKAPLNHLVDAVDKMQRNINLLTGQATDHKAINIQISEAIADKNG